MKIYDISIVIVRVATTEQGTFTWWSSSFSLEDRLCNLRSSRLPSRIVVARRSIHSLSGFLELYGIFLLHKKERI